MTNNTLMWRKYLNYNKNINKNAVLPNATPSYNCRDLSDLSDFTDCTNRTTITAKIQKNAKKNKNITLILSLYLTIVALTLLCIFIVFSSYYYKNNSHKKLWLHDYSKWWEEIKQSLEASATTILRIKNIHITIDNSSYNTINSTLSKEKIIKYAGINYNDNILSSSASTIKHRLDSQSNIKDSAITIHLPNTLQIHIRERNPVLAIKRGDKFILLDEDGYEIQQNDYENNEEAQGNITDSPNIPLVVTVGEYEETPPTPTVTPKNGAARKRNLVIDGLLSGIWNAEGNTISNNTAYNNNYTPDNGTNNSTYNDDNGNDGSKSDNKTKGQEKDNNTQGTEKKLQQQYSMNQEADSQNDGAADTDKDYAPPITGGKDGNVVNNGNTNTTSINNSNIIGSNHTSWTTAIGGGKKRDTVVTTASLRLPYMMSDISNVYDITIKYSNYEVHKKHNATHNANNTHNNNVRRALNTALNNTPNNRGVTTVMYSIALHTADSVGGGDNSDRVSSYGESSGSKANNDSGSTDNDSNSDNHDNSLDGRRYDHRNVHQNRGNTNNVDNSNADGSSTKAKTSRIDTASGGNVWLEKHTIRRNEQRRHARLADLHRLLLQYTRLYQHVGSIVLFNMRRVDLYMNNETLIKLPANNVNNNSMEQALEVLNGEMYKAIIDGKFKMLDFRLFPNKIFFIER